MHAMRLFSILQISIPFLLLQGQFATAATCSSKAAQDIVIAVDVGHFPRQPGVQCRQADICGSGQASSRGVPEYDFNLSLAKRVNEELVREGFRSTHLLIPVIGNPLARRADRANAMNADILLSIHHDGVRDEFLSRWTYDGQSRNYFDRSTGFSLHVSPKNPQYNDSLELARLMADRLMEKGLRFNRIHETGNAEGARVPFADSTRGIYRRDNLAVLRLTKMAAVLVEGGVIVNRDEELLVSTPAYQAIFASAVARSITEFCRPRTISTFRVVGVASNDVLNLRSGPDASTSIVHAIPPDGKGIRMAGICSGQWCQVEYLSAKGWVNRRYLTSEAGGN